MVLAFVTMRLAHATALLVDRRLDVLTDHELGDLEELRRATEARLRVGRRAVGGAPTDSMGFDLQVDRLRDAGERWTGNAVSAKVITSARLLEHVRSEDPIATAWRRDGIVLQGPELDRLIADPR
jgi:hypothetical protein